MRSLTGFISGCLLSVLTRQGALHVTYHIIRCFVSDQSVPVSLKSLVIRADITAFAVCALIRFLRPLKLQGGADGAVSPHHLLSQLPGFLPGKIQQGIKILPAPGGLRRFFLFAPVRFLRVPDLYPGGQHIGGLSILCFRIKKPLDRFFRPHQAKRP